MTPQTILDFRKSVLEYYELHGRHDLPWRIADTSGFDPYKIMVSEVMLQQTQVGRVIPKYEAFLSEFPNPVVLSQAPLKAVLQQWDGLGYNRRAQYLQRAATTIISEFGGTFPESTAELVKLPGIGANTAGAILAYAYNRPAIFIETNIRTVFIHHFFEAEIEVRDADIIELVSSTLDQENPRVWYWALMDYGTYLKQTVGNTATRSKSYVRQSTFEGSRRQIRGRVLKLLQAKSMLLPELKTEINDYRLSAVLKDLQSEAMITFSGNRYQL